VNPNETTGTAGAELLFSGWRYRALLLSVLLAAAGYLGFALFSGWGAVTAAVLQVGFLGVAVALALSLVNYGLRFVRWQMYLKTLGHAVPWRPSLQIYLAGFALTTTPGKAGEAFRGVLLKRRGVPYTDSLAAFFTERLSDLIAIVLLTLFGLTLYPEARPLILLGAGVAIAFLILLSRPDWMDFVVRHIPRSRRFGKWITHALEFLRQSARCNRPVILALGTGLSVLGWAAEAFAFFLILHWMGLGIGFPFAAFVFAIAMLAGALSFTPGGLGSTEGVMVALLVWHGLGLPEAVAATMLIRATTLWFAVFIGGLASLGTDRPVVVRAD
jgi:uncharacterized protein (TIRG00374 family)